MATTGFGFDVRIPAAPGRYRLVVTLHDRSGVAYDPSTQALVPALLVQVSSAFDAAIAVDGPTEAQVGTATSLPLWVTNLGKEAWGRVATPRGVRPALDATAARVVGQWLAIGVGEPGQQAAAAKATAEGELEPAHEPGTTAAVQLDMVVPTVAGEYLLVLDVVTPEGGSLVASGRDPIMVRMTIHPGEASTPRQ